MDVEINKNPIEKNGLPKNKKEHFFVVGIGASAGGIQALKIFFENVTADSGMAYVVILHLSPDHDSKLAEILQMSARIPVQRVLEQTVLHPNHIYVVPPNQHLSMVDGEIKVSPNLLLEDRRAPVDIFFRSLAASHGSQAISVILSGTGANGSMGMKHIKEQGGAAFVQSPRDAEFAEMPRNAIATELADEVLPVSQIPEKLLAYVNNIGAVHIPVDMEMRVETQQAALREIFTHLRLRTGHDFSNYKRPTLLRRIERRINIRNLPDLTAYAQYMRGHSEESVALLKDILISVTNFFRDPLAFGIIEEQVLTKIFSEKATGEQIRIWVAGCATGEEAYSLAMLCTEKAERLIDAPKIQIFASDIDEAAIAHAREGLYTINDAADVSASRLRAFFTKEGDHYRVKRELREMILFAPHNFLKDPPFSKLDLVSCRNVLIYLNQTGQERVLETFHFSLNPGAFLFLGSSESVDGTSDMYAQFNKEMRIFQTRQVGARAYPVPESIPVLQIPAQRPLSGFREAENRVSGRISNSDLHHRLLEQYAPPSIVVNEQFDIVHLSENAGKYLQVAGGELSQNLVKLIRPELRLEMRSALQEAVRSKTSIETKGLKLGLANEAETFFNIVVRPVLGNESIARGYLLILFEEGASKEVHAVTRASDEPIAVQLEKELGLVKNQLRNSVEHHEIQAEELKASNEELQAMNEELRSAAEELETSKEELQSINEELRAVNQELKIKIEETTVSRNNLENLINSVGIATIFLDRNLNVMLFTPNANDLFNLIPSDYGRSLSDITSKLEYHDLLKDADSVLVNLIPVEKEVRTTDDTTYMMRVLPYRTADDRINGVVITFVDIRKRKAMEESLRTSETNFRTLNDAVPQLIWANDGKGFANYFNRRWYEYSGLAYETSLGKGWEAIVHPEDAKPTKALWHKNLAEGTVFDSEMRLKRADGVYRWHIVRNVPTHAGDGAVTGWFGTATDIQELKTAERTTREVSERLRVTVESAIDFAILTLDTNGLILHWNKGAENTFGYSEKEVMGKPGDIIFTQEDRLIGAPAREQDTAKKTGRAVDERWHLRKDGSLVFMSGVLSPMYTDQRLMGFVKVARDITEQKRFEVELVALEERYRIALKSAEMGAWDWNITQNSIVWNEQHYTLFGIKPEHKLITVEYFMKFVHPDDAEMVGYALKKAVDEGGVYHAEFRIIRSDKNDIRWMSGYGRGLEVKDNRATRMVGVMYDITERKKLEKEKEDFINIASHELKTPLTSIKAYAEIIQESLEETSNHTHATYMQKLNLQVDRLNHLIIDLLDNTRVAEGQLALQLQSLDINHVIDECVTDMQHISKDHSFEIMHGKVSLISADKDRVCQVLVNLISNAIKYSPDGGKIVISTEAHEQGIKVSIRDQGIGIAEEMQAKVFGRFYRILDASINNAPGMGLGLYITAGIIHRHGGTIGLTSKLGEGSVFFFTLPKKPKAASAAKS